MTKRPNYETMNHEAKRRRIEGSGRKAQLERIYERDKGICQLCGNPVARRNASRDHIKDFALCTPEEARSDDNLQLAHTWCNEQKHWLPKSKIRVVTDHKKHLYVSIGELYPQLKDYINEKGNSGLVDGLGFDVL